MTILIAGGDRLGAFPIWMATQGGKVLHWPGRKHCRQPIPGSVKLIVLLTSFINHSLGQRLKKEAAKKGLRIVYARSLAEARMQLTEKGGSLA